MAKYCPNCGEPLGPGASFCGNCGTKLDPQPAPPPEQAPAQPEQTFPAPEQAAPERPVSAPEQASPPPDEQPAQYTGPGIRFAQQSGQPRPAAPQYPPQGERPANYPPQGGTQYAQPTYPPQGGPRYSQPAPQYPPQGGQQYAQPYPQPPAQPPKKNTGLIIGVSVCAAFLIGIIVALCIVVPIMKRHKTEPSTTAPAVTEQATTTPAEVPTDTPTEAVTEAPATEAPTEAPTTAPTTAAPTTQAPTTQTPTTAAPTTKAPATQPPTVSPTQGLLPYVGTLGRIDPTDFAWIADARSGGLQGSFLGRDKLVGKWKAEFVFEELGIWELVYITIFDDGDVMIQPYWINYGSGWENEEMEPSYDFYCSFDVNRVYGNGDYGYIDIFEFIGSNGSQYAQGTLNAVTGNTARGEMVRP